METPSKLALGACLLRNQKLLSATRQVIMDYPALEGFQGEVNPAFAGAPPDLLRNQIYEQCLNPTANSPARPGSQTHRANRSAAGSAKNK
jgi:hypothetical protein